MDLPRVEAVTCFGCSDCRRAAYLFETTDPSAAGRLPDALPGGVQRGGCRHGGVIAP